MGRVAGRDEKAGEERHNIEPGKPAAEISQT